MKENSIKNERSSMEETIKTIEKMIKSYKEADKCGLSNNDFKNEIKALEHILSDYRRLLKENEHMHNELDKQQTTINKYTKENEYYKECLEVVSKHLDNIDYDQILFAIYEYYISKQKVKDKIEYLKDYIEQNSDEQGYWGNTNPDVIYGQIEILEELLEESEE